MMATPTQIGLDPNWVVAAISLVALVVSGYALWVTKRNRRSEIEQALVQQRNGINIAFAEYHVRGPFAHLLEIKSEEMEAYTPKACLLFLQLNMLNDVYQHRKFLSKSSLASYESWAKRILSPWIHSDKHLLDVLKLIYATEDLMPKDVVAWLKNLIPAT
jgi:hypothetical protein